MPTPNGCYCNFSEWDVLVAILEQDIASFDRLQQLIQILSGGGGITLKSGSTSIASGVDTVTVVFPTPFASAPVVVVSISRPAAESLLDVNIDQASITATGFTVSLGGTTSSANYKLKWMAN